MGRMVGEASKEVGEPGAGVDAAEFAVFSERIDRGRKLSAGVGAAECPVAAPDGNGAFGGVVGQADAAVVEKPREGCHAPQAVGNSFGDRAL